MQGNINPHLLQVNSGVMLPCKPCTHAFYKTKLSVLLLNKTQALHLHFLFKQNLC